MHEDRYTDIPVQTYYSMDFPYSKSKLLTFIANPCYTNHYYNFSVWSTFIGAKCGIYLYNKGTASDYVDIRWSILYMR